MRGWVVFPKGRNYLLFQGSADGPLVGEVGAADTARKLSVRPGRYFVRGRAPDVLLEGTVDVPAGATVTVDESALTRTAYARLVRKGEGVRDSVQGLQAAFIASTALSDASGACLGVVAGYALEFKAITVIPRLAYCHAGFTNQDLSSSTNQLDAEVRGLRLGLVLGVAGGGADGGRHLAPANLHHQWPRPFALNASAAAQPGRRPEPRTRRACLPLPGARGCNLPL